MDLYINDEKVQDIEKFASNKKTVITMKIKKCDKPNKYGIIPSECINYNHGRLSCYYDFDNPCKCKAMDDKDCEKFNISVPF